jgi:hypothetical protein
MAKESRPVGAFAVGSSRHPGRRCACPGLSNRTPSGFFPPPRPLIPRHSSLRKRPRPKVSFLSEGGLLLFVVVQMIRSGQVRLEALVIAAIDLRIRR